MFHASPFLGGDSRRTRDILLLLRGDMGRGRRAPLRQEVARLAAAGDWRRRYSTWIGTSQELPGDRSTLLVRARYCLVLPIDGWSATFEDAVLHGCIPVVVSLGTGAGGSVAADAGTAAGGGGEGIAQPFSGVLRLASGMLEVPQSDLPDLPTQLAAIPPATEAALRAGLSSWWHRVAWLTHPFVKAAAAATVQANLERYPWVRSELEQQQVKQQQALAAMGHPPAAAAAADGADGAAPSSEQQEQDDTLLVLVMPEQLEGEEVEVGSDSGSSSGQEGSIDGQEGSSSLEDGSTEEDGSSRGSSDAAVGQVVQEAGASLDSSGSSNGSATVTANGSDSRLQPDGAGGTDTVQLEAVVQTEAEQVAELFAPRVWQPDGQLDDAFATLMQVSHAMQRVFVQTACSD
jgi:hypothetical protein